MNNRVKNRNDSAYGAFISPPFENPLSASINIAFIIKVAISVATKYIDRVLY